MHLMEGELCKRTYGSIGPFLLILGTFLLKTHVIKSRHNFLDLVQEQKEWHKILWLNAKKTLKFVHFLVIMDERLWVNGRIVSNPPKFRVQILWILCKTDLLRTQDMLKTSSFDYINVMGKAADAAWIRNECISNNIANADTPGYKRQDVSFEEELQHALKNSRYEAMDSKVRHLRVSQLHPRTYTDYNGYSYRVDGNNVDPDTEGVILAKNQIKYEGIMDSVQAEFKNLQSVMK